MYMDLNQMYLPGGFGARAKTKQKGLIGLYLEDSSHYC